jgi:glycosyltransferase involved in cell wall biosynthesis
MKICLVWKNEYPWDVRVEKIAKSLIDFGHEVHLVARNLRKEPTMEDVGGIQVHRIVPVPIAFLNKTLSLPVFFNPVWLTTLYKICVRHRIELIVVRDLPLVLTGVIVGKLLGIPVVFDMAENYPALWREINSFGGSGAFSLILKNPRLGAYLEKLCIKHVDKVIVVVEESRDRLINLGVPARKIVVVSNTPDVTLVDRLAENDAALYHERWKGRTVLMYQGFVNRARGLRTALYALPALVKRYPKLLLVIAGDGNDLENLKTMSAENGVSAQVEFCGWVDARELPAMMKASSIGLVPHCGTEHKHTTIPNKLFDFMACGKPVIVSSAKPLKRIVEKERAGLVFEADNVESFVGVASQMLDNLADAERMGHRGRNAIVAKYNWANDSSVLKRTIEEFQTITKYFPIHK